MTSRWWYGWSSSLVLLSGTTILSGTAIVVIWRCYHRVGQILKSRYHNNNNIEVWQQHIIIIYGYYIYIILPLLFHTILHVLDLLEFNMFYYTCTQIRLIHLSRIYSTSEGQNLYLDYISYTMFNNSTINDIQTIINYNNNTCCCPVNVMLLFLI